MSWYAEAEQDILRDMRHIGGLLNLHADLSGSDCRRQASTKSLTTNENVA